MHGVKYCRLSTHHMYIVHGLLCKFHITVELTWMIYCIVINCPLFPMIKKHPEELQFTAVICSMIPSFSTKDKEFVQLHFILYMGCERNSGEHGAAL